MRKLAWIAAASAVLVLTVVIGVRLLDWQGASAQGVVNFDIDPDTTGNTASTIGQGGWPSGVQDCARVDYTASGFNNVSDYNVDVVVAGDTVAPDYYNLSLKFSDSTLVHIAAPGTNRAIKMPSDTGTPFCSGDGLPDSTSPYVAGCAYLEGGTGTAGDGTLVRVGLDIDGTKSGVVTFSFNATPLTAYASGGGVEHPQVLGSGKLAINTSCPPLQYTLTMAVSPAGGGTTNPAVGPHTYDQNTVVPISATANAGYRFGSWSGDPDCSDASVTMNADKTCTANFILDTHTLTVSLAGTGSGTVTSSPAGINCGLDCTQDYNYGTAVTLTPTAGAGSHFAGWSGDPDCSDGSVTMNADRSCTATFTLDTPPEELTIDIRPGSYPNPINPKSKGVIPVAILTTDAFDASDIDPASARFEELARPVRWMLIDVDGDRDLDLLLYFRTEDTSIVAGQEEACLTATTFGGITLTGCDSIKVVPAKGAGGVHGGMLALGAPLGLLGIRLGRNALEKTRRRF